LKKLSILKSELVNCRMTDTLFAKMWATGVNEKDIETFAGPMLSQTLSGKMAKKRFNRKE
jgi:hypothetical protein